MMLKDTGRSSSQTPVASPGNDGREVIQAAWQADGMNMEMVRLSDGTVVTRRQADGKVAIEG